MRSRPIDILTVAVQEDPILVNPRWPSRTVLLSQSAYAKLCEANNLLKPEHIELVILRGYENAGILMNLIHQGRRLLGAAMFCLLYPHRFRERRYIFSPNGHDISADCVDVGIVRNAKRLKLLPLGVFTPSFMIKSRRIEYSTELSHVWRALKSVGFYIHPNCTESLQIHCETILPLSWDTRR